MVTKEDAHFRSVPVPNSCHNCGSITYGPSEGWSKCLTIEDITIPWPKKSWLVCDAWKPKKTKTEKEKILEKLTKHERSVLGL